MLIFNYRFTYLTIDLLLQDLRFRKFQLYLLLIAKIGIIKKVINIDLLRRCVSVKTQPIIDLFMIENGAIINLLNT